MLSREIYLTLAPFLWFKNYNEVKCLHNCSSVVKIILHKVDTKKTPKGVLALLYYSLLIFHCATALPLIVNC